MQSEGRLDAVDGLFGFLDHAVEQNLDRHDIVHETHAHAGAEDRAVDIAVLEGYAGLLAGDDGHLLHEHRDACLHRSWDFGLSGFSDRDF